MGIATLLTLSFVKVLTVKKIKKASRSWGIFYNFYRFLHKYVLEHGQYKMTGSIILQSSS
jgi:hypothetical protein